jgi:aspartate ammonia-lyase
MSDPRVDAAFGRSLRNEASSQGPTRTETDSLGSLPVPASAYWGINVARALGNFAISGRPISIYPDFIYGYACVKQAAARANMEIGVLPRAIGELIDRACEEVKGGALHEHFVVDVMQGGAGTSTNMNMNEVLANRALELGGKKRGEYQHVGPNDHVNKGQSTNDTYPTALKIGLRLAVERLLGELVQLERAFRAKAREMADIVKVGRTQLQDAVPMTLGQEFEAYADTLLSDHANFEEAMVRLGKINLGATAIGTGIAAHPRFAEASRKHLETITGHSFSTAPNLVEATTDVGVYMDLSAALKRVAIKLSKISNDLRLISSGPQAGFGEINLPPKQAGSSIMPGKVNPIIPEVVSAVAFAVAGGDLTLTMAAEAGQLQLNAFLPVMAHVLFENLKWMTGATVTLRDNCVVGITANTDHLEKQVASFVGVITALIPSIGYGAAAKLAQEALSTGSNIAELIVSKGLLSRERVTELLSPKSLTRH